MTISQNRKIRLLAGLAFLTLFFNTSDLYAFSLGTIKIKTSFNKKFHAEVPVFLDGPYPLEANLGTAADYERIGIERKSIVDNISVQIITREKENPTIRITSVNPLFQPSFNLVLKCAHNGGTIIENFLITVDFQKSLSLNLPTSNDITSEPVIKLPEKKLSPTQIAQNTPPPPIQKETTVPVKKPLPKKTVLKQAKQVKQKPPVKAKVEQKPITLPKKKSTPPKPKKKTPPSTVVTFQSKYGTAAPFYEVQKGDTLYQIARTIGASKSSTESVVVQIWKKNIDQFKFGNMNLLKNGVILDVDGVLENVKTISRNEAIKLIRSQWSDYKKGKKSPKTVLKKIGIPGLELPLPHEQGAWNEEKIAASVYEWKKRWEARDINAFMTLYSKKFRRGIYNFGSWKQFKTAFNLRHGNFSLDISNIHIRIEKNIAIATFTQHFVSKRMETVGTKNLHFKKENQKYKITKEVWEKELEEIKGKRPYVVHIASFRSHDLALREINVLRRRGYAAYEVLFEASIHDIYYRVVIDRFSTKTAASKFANTIMKQKLVDYGNPIKMPYSIDLGIFSSKSEAHKKITQIRKLGFSPYPLIDCLGEGCYYQILIGAYANENDAMPIAQKLTDAGEKNKIVTP